MIPHNLDAILKSFPTYSALRSDYAAHGNIRESYEEVIARLRDYDIDVQRDLQRALNRARQKSPVTEELLSLDKSYALHVASRVKSLESVYRKLCLGDIAWTDLPLDDTLGYRVICRFSDECRELRDVLEEELSAPPFSIISRFPRDDRGCWAEKVPDSGYRSWDFAFSYRRPEVDVSLEGELQLRTQLQHAWADVSHDTFYKNSDLCKAPAHVAESAQEAMHSLSDALHAADECFVQLRRLVVRSSRGEDF